MNEFLKSLLLFYSINVLSQGNDNYIESLMKHYPQIIKFSDNKLYFSDGSSLTYNDGLAKSEIQLLSSPGIKDQFYYKYSRQWNIQTDAGRIRNEIFFKKIYGSTKQEVLNNLVEITWCPKLVNQKIKVTKVNNIHKVFEKLSEELDQHPEYKKYIENIGGTFNWRKISGTKRLSNHSFGTAIDINVKYSNYWQWDCKCKDENRPLKYKNSIPEGLVKIFEKHGFIWGGKWIHYDTMHFEYRPEMLE